MTDKTTEAAGGELDAALANLDLLDRLGGLGCRAHDLIDEVRAYLRATPPSPDAGLVDALRLARPHVVAACADKIAGASKSLSAIDAALARPAAEPVAWQHRTLVEALRGARSYVVDALDAHEHSDGRDLLVRIDDALASLKKREG